MTNAWFCGVLKPGKYTEGQKLSVIYMYMAIRKGTCMCVISLSVQSLYGADLLSVVIYSVYSMYISMVHSGMQLSLCTVVRGPLIHVHVHCTWGGLYMYMYVCVCCTCTCSYTLIMNTIHAIL